jgi:L-fuculokinase
MAVKDIVVVFDCGATNVRVIAIDINGNILATDSLPNNTVADPFNPEYRIWDVGEIWIKICYGSQKIVRQVDPERIAGVTVTTFGVDGTLFDRDGKMLYPVISWQCERTKPIMSSIWKYIPLNDLYGETGVLPFSFNTINKLIWLRENQPDLIDRSYRFLFMPSIFLMRLTGEMVNDATMAGTSMVTNLGSRALSANILGKIGFPSEKFGPIAEPGTIIGSVTRIAGEETGLPPGIPVVATGHDTQFAVFGSGAEKSQPVLSSGTWEILMVRSSGFRTGEEQLNLGITTEFDSIPGLYNIGKQWIASGIIEWIRKNFFREITDNVYEEMIRGATDVPNRSNGVIIVPDFCGEIAGGAGGQILGLKMDTSRYEIFRAALEALSANLAAGRKALEDAGGFKTESIICVGGGSKNRLWNQLRADYTGVPVIITGQKETTVLGASLFVQAACGNSASPDDARMEVEYRKEVIEPRSV